MSSETESDLVSSLSAHSSSSEDTLFEVSVDDGSKKTKKLPKTKAKGREIAKYFDDKSWVSEHVGVRLPVFNATLINQ